MKPVQESKPCPTGCGRVQPKGKFMCRPCWNEVPKHLQGAVYASWRAWSRDFGDVDKLHAYRAATDAALASIA